MRRFSASGNSIAHQIQVECSQKHRLQFERDSSRGNEFGVMCSNKSQSLAGDLVHGRPVSGRQKSQPRQARPRPVAEKERNEGQVRCRGTIFPFLPLLNSLRTARYRNLHYQI